MSRQNAFWRKPDGKPEKGHDHKNAPTAILAALGKSSRVTEDGRVTFDFHASHENWVSLLAALDDRLIIQDSDGRELNRSDTERICYAAIKTQILQVGAQEALKPKRLLDEINNQSGQFFRQSTKDYHLLVTLSVTDVPFKATEVLSRIITPLRDRGIYDLPSYLKNPKGLEKVYKKHLRTTKYRCLAVHTTGRSVSEAFTLGLRAIDYLRGVWLLGGVYRTRGERFAKLMTPIGCIHTGPIYTLHEPSGQPVDQGDLYLLDYFGDQELYTPVWGWKTFEESRKRIMENINGLPYKDVLIDLIIRYMDALHQIDLSTSLLHLWSVLERITGTLEDRYDETIRRACWLFPQDRTIREILDSIRVHRNLYVHSAKSEQNADEAVYSIKRVIDQHLFLLINNNLGVQSLEEYAENLALSNDLDALKRRRKKLDIAIRYFSSAGAGGRAEPSEVGKDEAEAEVEVREAPRVNNADD